MRVFASWMSYQTWTVHPRGCQGVNISDCEASRGGFLTTNQSSTWDDVGLYAFEIETNLGMTGNGYFGYDVVGLGGIGEQGPTLQNTTVGNFAVTDYWIGYFGLNPKPTNWTSFENGATSYMTQLKQQSLIPSVSFGYTAGAPYRFSSVLASLTLGGYDSSRFESSNVEFTFAADNSRDTVVAIQSITTSSQSSSSTTSQLLPNPIYALVDASVPQIWLPLEACQAFEKEFGLVYDSLTGLYLINSTLHSSLLARNATVTFTLAQGTSGGSTVQIALPYAAFDLTAHPPYQGLVNTTTYFPLRRAQNDTQYTLGRTFMQEAYITVDYERAKFNLSQVSWVQNAPAKLVTIPAASAGEASDYSGNTVPSKHRSTVSAGAIGGIVAGVAVVLGIVAVVALWFLRRKRTSRRSMRGPLLGSRASRSTRASTSDETVQGDVSLTTVFPKAELEAPFDAKAMRARYADSAGPGSFSELASPVPSNGVWVGEKDSRPIFEMPGSTPDLALMDGRQITEKEMMQHRERVYNGQDPQVAAEDRPTEQQRRVAVEPNEVREATEGEGGNARYSFLDGDDRTPPPNT